MKNDSKILLVTGKRAEDDVRKYSRDSDIETEIVVLPVPIASFINLDILTNYLSKEDLEEVSTVIIPGMAELNLKNAREELDTEVIRGPKFAADIPIILENFEELDLSKEDPADEFLENSATERVEKLISEAREGYEGNSDPNNFEIGEGPNSVLAGKDFPPRVVAEVVDAPCLSDEEFLKTCRHYIESGAEILDIGMTAEEDNSQEIPRLVSLVKDNFDIPVSIDSTDRAEIETAVEAGVDLVISLDSSNIDYFEGLDIPAVLIPRDSEKGFYPSDPGERVEYLEEILNDVKSKDYRWILADPILEPVGKGFTESLTAFRDLNRERDVSLFMGIGNVVELFDADSIGMTSVLVGSAFELGVDLILAVEGSDKTRGNIEEVVQARDMMMLADERGSVPKDLGLDLLRHKEKRIRGRSYDNSLENECKVVEGSSEPDFQKDEKGYFNIYTDEGKIVAVYHNPQGENLIIKGKEAQDIINEISERELVSELSHALYLGGELEKAEIAIRTDRSYVQEEPLF